MSPLTTRLFLGLTLLLAIGVAVFSITGIHEGQKEAWATLAASLAVVTSMVSAWGAQRVVELEEQRLEPYPYPQFDATSRYGLMLLKITNFGGGAAHNIKLIWEKPLKNSRGQEVGFAQGATSGELSILLPGQHISKIVDGHIQLFQLEGPHIYSGTVEYQDSKGSRRSHRFLLDAEAYKDTPLYDDESINTHHELQKIPERLQALCEEVKKIGQHLGRS
jgi:hypothetical protein